MKVIDIAGKELDGTVATVNHVGSRGQLLIGLTGKTGFFVTSECDKETLIDIWKSVTRNKEYRGTDIFWNAKADLENAHVTIVITK